MSRFADFIDRKHIEEIESMEICKWRINEVWKDIKGYEGLYKVSNLGRVKSLKKNIILKPIPHYKGYITTVLYKNNKQKHFFTHRLVAETFILNPNNLPEVNHKDENKQNNKVDNLEWCTRKYNMNYNEINKKRNSKKVIQYDKNGNFIKEWKCIMDIQRELRINNSNICQCCKGKYKSAGGYVWKYMI